MLYSKVTQLHAYIYPLFLGFPSHLGHYRALSWASQLVLVVKKSPANAGDIRDAAWIPGSGRSPGGGHGNPLMFLPGESHEQRSLAGYSPKGSNESDTTEAT